MNSKKTIVILAGGLGSRFNGLKQIESMLENEETIMEFSMYDGILAGFNKFVIIINSMVPESFKERISEILAKRNVEVLWVIQTKEDFTPENFDSSEREKPWGTGHALLCTKEVVNEPFFLINADDFYGREIYKLAAKSLDEKIIDEKTVLQIAFPLHKTVTEHGKVSRGVCSFNENKELLAITERHDIQIENGKIIDIRDGEKIVMDPETLVSMNFWCFHPSIFKDLETHFYQFLSENPSPKTEFLIPTFVSNLMNEGKIKVLVENSPSEWMGVTYRSDKELFQEFIRTQISLNKYPAKLWS